MNLGSEKINITDNLDLFARQVVEGFLTGFHKSPYHGFSVEFAEHRAYNFGDPIKNIDWKLFARSNKLFVKKFEEETNLRSYLLLDISSSMLYPFKKRLNKLSFSIFSAACLMYLFRKQRDAFSLSFFSDKIDFFSNSKSSKTHYNRLLSELDKRLNLFNDNHRHIETDFSYVISKIVGKIHQRSLIIIFSDLLDFKNNNFDKLLESLQYLKHTKSEVILFHVKDEETEFSFNFDNIPYDFIDLETHQSVKLNPITHRDQYTRLINDFQSKIKAKCDQYKIDYISASIEKGFSSILLSYLYKRSKLF